VNFGVIDIGSNGIRVLIAQHLGAPGFKEIFSVRAPIRLGEDVFTKGAISTEKQKALVEAMVEFSQIFKQKKSRRSFCGCN
jgi:exopolyphosphatase/guanosine-5'-triphosphate,3'-diphosphate pyrophosphatase